MCNDRDLDTPQRDFLALMEAGTLPLMAAPMFLVSGPELVVACAKAGITGSFPAANARNLDILDAWMAHTRDAVQAGNAATPWALNMIVHKSYDRFDRELELVRKYQPRIVSTALGSPRRVLDTVHGYGGIVMADVASPTMARKAADAGADVLVLVSSGAGGHTGHYHPFAFVAEVRKFWSGPLGLAGAVTRGTDIRAAQLLGADFVLAGTRFIATAESQAMPAYRDMVVSSHLEDLVQTKAVSGVLANWLKPSLEAAGFTEEQLREEKKIDFSGDIVDAPKAWKTVWSAGHGVGGIHRVAPVGDVVRELRADYDNALRMEQIQLQALCRRYLAAAPSH
ncbi:NAD(P)H-dependent flavin oxidoreductase [Delftia sp. PS-11]|uniref:NAD(P)H-dependent flavin oxidoreductase n=1 Tax=Delftia sp. PS-11 TaxID=2767222 RepID=UPI002458A358|nr:nitronate monooxygenase [Delftia sp. PS-11]KAJ8742267.1 nitronate monooxygenase [Delftia sp. PS-11]